eukprot:699100-Alexandrium_andersonii.AAC.1
MSTSRPGPSSSSSRCARGPRRLPLGLRHAGSSLARRTMPTWGAGGAGRSLTGPLPGAAVRLR